jgi:hypothetical protein
MLSPWVGRLCTNKGPWMKEYSKMWGQTQTNPFILGLLSWPCLYPLGLTPWSFILEIPNGAALPYNTKWFSEFKPISRTAYGKTSIKQMQQIKCTSCFGMRGDWSHVGHISELGTEPWWLSWRLLEFISRILKNVKDPVLILIFCLKENWNWCFSHFGILEKPELRVIRKSNTYSPNARLVPIRRKEGRKEEIQNWNLWVFLSVFLPQKRNPHATVLGLWNNF